MIEKNYAGLDGFIWWMGVVESRQDPLGLGRCQVRVFGFHSPSLSDIPSKDLPWAHPANSLNGSSLALPRILACLLENKQTPNGIELPAVLVPYLGANFKIQ